ncbi:MAG TPA: molybdate ABC transporter substrate-binding protein [Thermoanaerobacterales bacterium]|jgi:molybdate transport system substrate-binding protein|nr:molybdate ABC transporter substrate-binding protein [Thermoanaerobacterales bacterium]
MKSLKKLVVLLLILSLFAMVGCSSGQEAEQQGEDQNQVEQESDQQQAEETNLLVFSGAGLKKPMEEIKKVFESENNVKIEYTYGGSSHLLSQMELSKKGDVFISGSMDAYEAADKKGLVNPCKQVAYHIPVIAVPKGNPAGIKSLEDLAKPGVRVILGDEEANAIGKAAQRIIKKTGLEDINKNVVAKTGTINELVTHLTTTNKVDATIVTIDAIKGNEKAEMIEIPEDQNSIEIIPVCSLKNASNPEMAEKFVEFIASDEGKAIFDKHGFKPVE